MKESLENLAWEVAKKKKPGASLVGRCALAVLSLAVATKQRLPVGGAPSSLMKDSSSGYSRCLLGQLAMVLKPSLCDLMKR